jgi:hypothetical protein
MNGKARGGEPDKKKSGQVQAKPGNVPIGRPNGVARQVNCFRCAMWARFIGMI